MNNQRVRIQLYIYQHKHKTIMQIKTQDGERNVTGQAQGTLNSVLGAVGALGTLMGGGSILGGGGIGLGRNGYYNGNDPDSRVVTKAEANLMQENGTLKTENAILKSEGYTDKKLVEVTTYVNNQMRRLEDKVDANYREQKDINAEQMAYNAKANATIEVLRSQVAALSGVTQVVIPSKNVCETGCGCGCSR